MKETIKTLQSLLPESAQSSLDEILTHSLEYGEAPLFLIPNLPQDLKPAYNHLLQTISATNIDKSGFGIHYAPDVELIMELLSAKRREKHLQACLDFQFFTGEISKRNPELLELMIKDGDDQGLICTKKLDSHRQWFSISDKAVFVHEARLGYTNSVLPLSNLLGKSDKIFIRPDCYKLLKTDNYYERMELAGAHGKAFNQSWLDTFKGVETATHFDDKSDYKITGDWTQFVWEELDNSEVQFSCEELPNYETPENITAYNTTRFMHGIYDRRIKKFTHLDGALHIYTQDEYIQRLNLHLKEHFNTYRKVKIYRIDESLSLEHSQKFIEAFYRWNYLVPEYFSNHKKK